MGNELALSVCLCMEEGEDSGVILEPFPVCVCLGRGWGGFKDRR